MISFLLSWDVALFFLVNSEGQNAFFDWLMPFVTDLKNFRYVFPLLVLWILWREKKGGLVFLVFAGLTLTLTDQFSSHLLKDWVGRFRPCQALEGVRLLTDCNRSFSFPSSHAVNIFAMAFFISQPLKGLSPLFYAIAVLVGFSRIYIGIHYPSDILGGAAIGLGIAWPMRRLCDGIREKGLLRLISPVLRPDRGKRAR